MKFSDQSKQCNVFIQILKTKNKIVETGDEHVKCYHYYLKFKSRVRKKIPKPARFLTYSRMSKFLSLNLHLKKFFGKGD